MQEDMFLLNSVKFKMLFIFFQFGLKELVIFLLVCRRIRV